MLEKCLLMPAFVAWDTYKTPGNKTHTFFTKWRIFVHKSSLAHPDDYI